MIHCRPLKLLPSSVSRIGRMTGTLEISSPNIRDAKHASESVRRSRAAGEREVMGLLRQVRDLAHCRVDCSCAFQVSGHLGGTSMMIKMI